MANKVAYKRNKYDDYNKIVKSVYCSDDNGFEAWIDYNCLNKIIYAKYILGMEEFITWYEYNEDGKEIHYKDSNGYEEWIKYSNRTGNYLRTINNSNNYIKFNKLGLMREENAIKILKEKGFYNKRAKEAKYKSMISKSNIKILRSE